MTDEIYHLLETKYASITNSNFVKEYVGDEGSMGIKGCRGP